MIESLNNVASKSAAQTKGLLVIYETSYGTLTNYLNVLSVDIHVAILFFFFSTYTHQLCSEAKEELNIRWDETTCGSTIPEGDMHGSFHLTAHSVYHNQRSPCFALIWHPTIERNLTIWRATAKR